MKNVFPGWQKVFQKERSDCCYDGSTIFSACHRISTDPP